MQDFCILRQDEILILASAFHLKQVYGLAVEKSDEQMVPYRIHEMVRNGILHLKDERLQVSPFHRRIFQTITTAKRIVMIRRMQRDEKFYWYYIGTDVVCMEESFEDKDAVRMSLCGLEEFRMVIEEQGMLPCPLLSKELALLEKAEEVEARHRMLPVCFQYDLLWLENGDIQKQETLELIQSEHNYWLIEKKVTGTQLHRYDPEELYQKMIYMAEEEFIL